MNRCFPHWRSLLTVAAILLFTSRVDAQAVCGLAIECPRDIWMVDTHCLEDCDCEIGKAGFLRLNERCQWVKESRETFHSSHDPATPLVFFLPGYRTNERFAVEHGLALHKKLQAQAECHGQPCAPFRLVIWSWPSEKSMLGFTRDARNKAERAEREGLWVAMLIAKTPPESKVGLVGYSFGARIATACAQDLAGGYCGDCQFEAAPAAPRLRGALIASAIDATWLCAGQPHGMAIGRFEQLLLVNNCKDVALKQFRVLDRNARPAALGTVGLAFLDAASFHQVEQLEVSGIVGRTHDWYRYIGSREIMDAVASRVLYLEK